CMSPKNTSITRASPQCHDFRCNQDTAIVWTFAHPVHILVAAGIDSRVHLTRIHAPHCTHGGAGPTTQSDSQTSDTLLLIWHQPMHTVRRRPARKERQLATAVPPTLVAQCTTQCRSAR